jgi:hypothetical protein
MHPRGNNDCFETNSIDWVKQNEWLGYNDSLKSNSSTIKPWILHISINLETIKNQREGTCPDTSTAPISQIQQHQNMSILFSTPP